MNDEKLPRAAVWWIARKDLARVWPLALAVVGLVLLSDGMGHRPRPFAGPHFETTSLITFAGLIALVFLVMLIVQQDPIPGSDQDWIVRPIRRIDLLLAKLLVIVAVVHIPDFLATTAMDMADGHRLAQVIPRALCNQLMGACVVTLPVMAVAAVTRTVVEALIAALAVAITAIGAIFLYWSVQLILFHTPPDSDLAVRHAVAWVWQSTSLLVMLLTGATSILLAYLWRRIRAARVVLLLGVVLAITVALCAPWRLAYAFQDALSPDASTDGISIAFAPGANDTLRRLTPPWSSLLLRYAPRDALPMPPFDGESAVQTNMVRIVMPFEVTGLPRGATLHGDNVTVRLAASGGDDYRGFGWSFDLQPDTAGTALLGQAIDIPQGVYDRLAHREVTIHVEFAMTLMHGRSFVLAVPSQPRTLPGLGRCAVRQESGSSLIDVGCITNGGAEPCVTAEFDPPFPVRTHYGMERCPLDYTPGRLTRLARRSQFEIQILPAVINSPGIPFSVSKSQVTLHEYSPFAHTMRSVSIKVFGLAPWRYQPTTTPPPGAAHAAST